MASKSDAPPRRAEPVADQHPEDDDHDSSEQPPESQSADAVDVSKLLRMSPFKCPRTPPPARCVLPAHLNQPSYRVCVLHLCIVHTP